MLSARAPPPSPQGRLPALYTLSRGTFPVRVRLACSPGGVLPARALNHHNERWDRRLPEGPPYSLKKRQVWTPHTRQWRPYVLQRQIQLTLAGGDIRITDWKILDSPDHETGPDYRVLERTATTVDTADIPDMGWYIDKSLRDKKAREGEDI